MRGADPYYPGYKAVRNRIRKYAPASLLREALDVLAEIHVGGLDVMKKYQPWIVLLMIKWILEEADETSHRRAKAGRNELHQIYNGIYTIEDAMRLPSEYAHPTLFMRQLAYQQFWLKYLPDAAALARQELLFATLPPDHPFQRDFKAKTGLSIADFTQLSFGLMAVVMQGPVVRAVTRDNFAVADAALGPGALDAFLRFLSKSMSELRAWLREEDFKGVAVADQLILRTPLLATPLLKGRGQYFIWYPALLLEALKSVVYRTLRSANPHEFAQRFGHLYQAYLARCLNDAGVNHWTEAQLIAALPGSGKCVDFLLVDENCTVLVEAKAVEMSTLGQVARSPDAIVRAVKDCVVKAMVQGLAMERRLQTGGHAVSIGTDETFLLAVTPSELYLGSNQEFGALFGDRLVPRMERDFGHPLPIPVDNMFFITVDEFERLLARVQAGQTSIVKALRFARTEDAGPQRKFMFQQHLDELCPQNSRLPLLQQTFEMLVDRTRGRFFPNEQAEVDDLSNE